MGVGLIGLPLLLASPVALDEHRFPVGASRILEDVPTFHDDVVGGYLIYQEALAVGVFIDDRAELYRERIEELVELQVGAIPWEPVFERDGIRQALLRVGEPLVDDLASAGWSTTYTDDEFVVLRP